VDEALSRIRTAEDLIDQSSSVAPVIFYELACAYGASSAAAGGAAPSDAQRDRCKRLAVAALRRAVAAGYNNLGRIRRDLALEPLRLRADFQEVVMDAAFPSEPFGRDTDANSKG
jgi:hypothetical protein